MSKDVAGDPWYVTAGVELVSSTGLDIGRRVLRLGLRARDRRAFVRGQLDTDRDLRYAIELAGRRLTSMAEEVPGVHSADLRAFIKSPEAAQIVRQLFVLGASPGSAVPSSAKSQFLVALSRKVGIAPEQLEPHAG